MDKNEFEWIYTYSKDLLKSPILEEQKEGLIGLKFLYDTGNKLLNLSDKNSDEIAEITRKLENEIKMADLTIKVEETKEDTKNLDKIIDEALPLNTQRCPKCGFYHIGDLCKERIDNGNG
jgi:predicted Zn-ribbon and HTH transcriptional regulator